MIFRRLRSALFALWFAVWSIFVPIMATEVQAATIIPFKSASLVPVGGGAGIALAAASGLGKANLWGAGLTIGLVGMNLLLSSQAGQQILVAAKNAIFPTPAGWASPTTPPAVTQPVGTGSTASVIFYAGNTDATKVFGSSAEGVCTSYYGKYKGQNPGWSPYYQATNPTTTGGSCQVKDTVGNIASFTSWATTCPSGYSQNGQTCTAIANVCPAGYTLTNGSCQLSNQSAVMWPSDGIATVVSDGYSVWPSTVDPDPMPTNMSVSDVMNAQHQFFMDQYANKVMQSVQPTTDGGLQFTQAVQVPSPVTPNTNQVVSNTVTLDKNGTVVAAGTTTTPGDMPDPSTKPTVDFPTDYNREGTQGQILQELQAPNAVAMPDQAAVIAEAKTTADRAAADLQTQIQNGYATDKSLWFSWVWTPPIGSCSPSEGTVHGVGLSVNYCGITENVRSVVGWLFAVYGGITIYGQLFRKPE